MKKYIILLSALAGALAAAAQLTAEIDVERTVVPRLEQQKPLASMMPSVVQGSDGKMRLNLSEYSGERVSFTPLPVEVGMPVFSGLPTASPYRGYVWAGYFPVYNAGAGAGYRFIDNASSQVEGAVRFAGSSYSNNFDGNKSHAVDNSVGVHAGARHTFASNTTVFANADYDFTALESPYSQAYSSDMKLHRVRAAVGIESRFKQSKYSAEAFVDYLGARTSDYMGAPAMNMGASENVYGLRGRYDGSLPDSTLGYWLEIAVRGKHRSGLMPFEGMQTFTHGSDGWQVKAQPGFRLRRNAYIAEIGLNVDYSHNLGGKAVQIAPIANAAWTPTGIFSVYGTTTGGSRLAVQGIVYNYSPFAAGVLAYGDMFTLYNARIGVTFGPIEGASIDIYGRTASTRRAPMINSWGRNDVFLEPTDVSGFAAGIDLDYRHAIGHARAGFQAMQHSATHAFVEAPDRPAYTAYIAAEARINDRIGINAGWNFRGGRRYYILSRAESLGNISNVNIGGSYRFDSCLTFTLNLENILCRRAQIMPGLRQSPLTGLLAATYLF